jgi:hypothetical protein
MDWDEKQEHYRRRIAEARELLADLDAYDNVLTVRSYVVEAESYYSPAPSELQSFGIIPLRSSVPMRRWRTEAEATKRRQQAYAAQQEREYREQQRQAAERAALPEMPEVWINAIGEAMAEHVSKKVGELRAELTTGKHDSNLPALPVFRRRSDAA